MEAKAGVESSRSVGSIIQISKQLLLGDRTFLFGVTAQFAYVGAQVGIWSYTIRYVQLNVPGTTEQQAADYLLASLLAFVVGRFSTTKLIRTEFVSIYAILKAYACIACLLSLSSAFLQNRHGCFCLVSISFFLSTIFPTIFSLALAPLSDDAHRKVGAALIVMSIIGGAVVTAIMGGISDLIGISMAFIVPAVCFVVVFMYGRHVSRVSAPAIKSGSDERGSMGVEMAQLPGAVVDEGDLLDVVYIAI